MPAVAFRIILFTALTLLLSVSSYAQMPGWMLIIDKDGNRYYLDKYGKIRTSGEPEFTYKAVSSEGIEYYLNQGIELIKNHNKTEGLTLLKSIMTLPVKNDNIYQAQVKASKEINRLLTREGERFKKLNDAASLLLYIDGNSVFIVNDNMHFSLKCPLFIKILSKRERIIKRYKYSGLLLGINFEKTITNEKSEKDTTGFDLLLAIDGEIFPNAIKNAAQIENHWKKRLGTDSLERMVLQKDESRIVISYKDTVAPHYSGFEGFYSGSNCGYYIKAITSENIINRYRQQMLDIVKSFIILNKK